MRMRTRCNQCRHGELVDAYLGLPIWSRRLMSDCGGDDFDYGRLDFLRFHIRRIFEILL